MSNGYWHPRAALTLLLVLSSLDASAQSRVEQQAVGSSVSYVFATDLGSGIYNLNGRTLQIYQLTWRKQLREATPERFGMRFELPVTFGFFDFKPVDVIYEGIPKRVDSYTAVPGFSLDYLLPDDWHLLPYARAGFSVASSSVDGWLYGVGVRLEKNTDFHGWDAFDRSELAYAGVNYRHNDSQDQFLRLRQGFDLRRGLGWTLAGREAELGLYGIFDLIVDPPTVPVNGGQRQSIQAEFGFTLATRPRFKIWRWDAPRLGFGYRLAGELTAWRFVIGAPF